MRKQNKTKHMKHVRVQSRFAAQQYGDKNKLK